VYEVYAPKMEGQDKFRSQFQLTEHRGDHVVSHSIEDLVLQGSNDLALFDSEEQAIEAAVRTAFTAIDKMVEDS